MSADRVVDTVHAVAFLEEIAVSVQEDLRMVKEAQRERDTPCKNSPTGKHVWNTVSEHPVKQKCEHCPKQLFWQSE